MVTNAFQLALSSKAYFKVFFEVKILVAILHANPY